MKPARRGTPKDGPRKNHTKPGVLVQERVEYIDYKDVALLERCVTDRSKIRAGRTSGNDTQQQRELGRAVKNAREMALLPYMKRVTGSRTARAERSRPAALTIEETE
jgi:small subunit ribosomal protein S18